MENLKPLSEDTLRILNFSILSLEKENAKTQQRKDQEMVDEIVKIIKKEVMRESRDQPTQILIINYFLKL